MLHTHTSVNQESFIFIFSFDSFSIIQLVCTYIYTTAPENGFYHLKKEEKNCYCIIMKNRMWFKPRLCVGKRVKISRIHTHEHIPNKYDRTSKENTDRGAVRSYRGVLLETTAVMRARAACAYGHGSRWSTTTLTTVRAVPNDKILSLNSSITTVHQNNGYGNANITQTRR